MHELKMASTCLDANIVRVGCIMEKRKCLVFEMVQITAWYSR